MKKSLGIYALGIVCVVVFLYVALHYGAYTTKRDTEALIQFRYENAVRP